MQAADFRRIALCLPEAIESAHMGYPDFRVAGKIFATLRADEATGVIKLQPEQQEMMVAAEPDMFHAVVGSWGKKGWTTVLIDAMDEVTLTSALTTAWYNVAPKKLINAVDQA